MLSTLLANALWIALSLPDAVRWRWATRHVAAAQAAVRRRIRHPNRATQYAIRNTQHETAPLTRYADYAPFIERIAAGEPNVLTAEPVTLLEPTSGTSGGSKLIPYTASLKREFQRGIGPWVVHTFLRHPSLFLGKAYWSVTPVSVRNRRSPGGIPIGFEEESEYFGGLESRLIRSVMAVPPAVKLIADMASFRYVTLLFLLACPNLRLVSVWNPTFFTLLLKPLAEWWPQLVKDIRHGTLTPPGPLDPDVGDALLAHHRADPQRAAQITRIFTAVQDSAVQDSDQYSAQRYAQLWPHLRLISCWADANAAPYAQQLAALFPQAELQPKGLLSTEGFVSFPFEGSPTRGEAGHALSLHSHFYEFLPEREVASQNMNRSGDEARGGETLLAHELALGEQYEVVITTGGGLVRYRTGDLVTVTGFVHQCPLLRFDGRSGLVSDWFGEKLHEAHVARVVTQALSDFHIRPAFALLACETAKEPPRYVLFLESGAVLESPAGESIPAVALAQAIENGLAENVHYAYCRSLGQLGPVETVPIAPGGMACYLERCVAEGQRLGDVKPSILDRRSGWAALFSDHPLFKDHPLFRDCSVDGATLISGKPVAIAEFVNR